MLILKFVYYIIITHLIIYQLSMNIVFYLYQHYLLYDDGQRNLQ
uniref:Uncharacterized protein n=1 Tax=Myoviridae sp. ctCo31 TaxID=2825053 RepID=A0A8S5UMX0_9CAUD|nr:MAG TPA: hypothetical protein [Myoviridae sp. ctCo31]